MLSDVPTEFYIAVAPQTLSKGISITAECYDNLSKINKSTSRSITIARNHIVPVANIDIDVPVPNKYILYTSSDGKIVTPYSSSSFGASIVSNTYENGIGKIVFNGNVTKIGNNAFYGCSKLTSITIPESVTSIDDYAFFLCDLTSIAIPPRVTSIGNYAFYNCRSLTSVTIGNSVTSIGNYTFYLCTSLKSINIPDSVTSIGEWAFGGCPSLTSVYITDIAKWCTIKFGNGSSNPLNYADIYLNGELVKDLAIPDGVTSIENYAFYSCSGLTSVTIPDNVTSIGDSAFEDCGSLTSIYCKPITPPALGSRVFSGISSSAKIYVPTASVDAYKSATGWSSYASKIEGYDF